MPLSTFTGSRGLFCLSFSFPELIHRTIPARQMRILKQPLCCLYQGNIFFQIENNSGTQAPAGSGYIPKSFSFTGFQTLTCTDTGASCDTLTTRRAEILENNSCPRTPVIYVCPRQKKMARDTSARCIN